MVSLPVGLFKLMLDLFHTVFKGENTALVIFIKYTSIIGLCLDAYEPNSYKLGVMLDTIKL